MKNYFKEAFTFFDFKGCVFFKSSKIRNLNFDLKSYRT